MKRPTLRRPTLGKTAAILSYISRQRNSGGLVTVRGVQSRMKRNPVTRNLIRKIAEQNGFLVIRSVKDNGGYITSSN